MTIEVEFRKNVFYNKTNMSPLNMSKLELDIDPLAERHSVMDRNTGKLFYIGKNDKNVHYLAGKYAIDGNLVVTIFDADQAYNAAVADGVKCEPIDLAAIS